MINFEEKYAESSGDNPKEEKAPEAKEQNSEAAQSKTQSVEPPQQNPQEEVKKDKDMEKKLEEKEDTKGHVGEQAADDVVGKESISSRKYSSSVGAGLADIASKSAKEIESKDKLPEKLQEELEKTNKQHEQKEDPKRISEFEVVNQDHMLKPYEHDIRVRMDLYRSWLKRFDDSEGGLLKLAQSYKKFGLNKVEGGIMYREWAPSARRVCLCGDFNGWNRDSHACNRDKYGVWELFIPDQGDGTPGIKHGSKVKASLVLSDGSRVLLADH